MLFAAYDFLVHLLGSKEFTIQVREVHRCWFCDWVAVRAGVPLQEVEKDGRGFLRWAYQPMKKYLKDKKQATYTEGMFNKAKKLGIASLA